MLEDMADTISDSNFGSESADESTSISSSVYEHQYGKRRYHGVTGNPYPFPNDELEKERLDQLQYCIRALLGENVVVPIPKNPTQIIDIGAGTGAWVVEVADQFPSATVYGTDLSPIQPKRIPSNAKFREEDITQGLNFDDGSTDLVQSRFLHAGVTIAQWPVYMREILRVLKPSDGWAQMMELGYPYVISGNNSLPSDAPVSKLTQYLQEHLREKKQILMDGGNLEQLMLDAGFVNVKSRKIKIEVGDWGSAHRDNKNLADAWINVWSLAMEALAEQMISYILNDEERADFVDGVKSDIRNMDYQLYCYLYLVTGRKSKADV